MAEWQSCCSLNYGPDCMLMVFAAGVLLGCMRGKGTLHLTKETALSLLMHWSVSVCLCVTELDKVCLNVVFDSS